MKESAKTSSNFFKPKLGFFSYVPSNPPAAPETKPPRSHSMPKPKANFSLTHSEKSFLSVGCEYVDPKYFLTRNSSFTDTLPHIKAFKPAGTVPSSFNFPYMPSLYQDPEKPIFNKKNIIVSTKNGIFSSPEYISVPYSRAVKKNKERINNKKPFVGTVCPKTVFSGFVHDIHERENLEKLHQKKTETSKVEEREDQGKSKGEESGPAFKAGGRSTSQLFEKLRYEADVNFPAKKKPEKVGEIHEKPFRPANEMGSVACPSIVTSIWTLRKENHLF